MLNSNTVSAELLEDTIGYHFTNRELLKLALTHPSLSGEMKKKRTESNQRLEFLGDAVLELVVSTDLYQKHSKLGEGELTRMRASLVCEPALCVCAHNIELGRYLYLGKGEDICGGREKPSILCDAFEALIGAIYLDGGFDAAKSHIHRFVLGTVEEFALLKDGKSMFQEEVQKDSSAELSYETGITDKDTHQFHSYLRVNGEIISEGDGHTKKAAEQDAALKALEIFRKRN